MLKRKALIVVDVQVDFCEGGALPVAGGAAVADRIRRLVATRRGDYAVIVGTRDRHIDPGPHFAARGSAPDYRESWPVHCVAGTPGAEFHPALDAENTLDAVLNKGAHSAAYSAFEAQTEDGADLAEVLAERRIQSVHVVGLATDYCVRATVLDALRHGLHTTVLIDLIAGVAGDTTRRTIDEMCHAGAEVTATAEVCA